MPARTRTSPAAALAVVAVLAVTLAPLAASSAPASTWLVGDVPTPATSRVRLTAALITRDPAALDAAYDATTLAGIPNSGAHATLQRRPFLTQDEVRAIVAPSDADTDLALDFFWTTLACADVQLSLGGDAIFADGCDAGAVGKAFGAPLYPHTHAHSGRVAHRVRVADRSRLAHRVPREIAHVVELVLGVTDLFESRQEQRMRKQAVLEGQRVATGSNAPYIAGIDGNETSAELTFEVFCKDGSPSSTVDPPCSDATPAVASFTLDAVVTGAKALNETVDVDTITCELQGAIRRSVVCKLGVSLPAFAETNFSLTTHYTDASSSDTFAYPAPFRPRPYATTSFVQELYQVPQQYRRGSNPNNSQAIVSFEKQWWSTDDLMAFFKLMGIPAQTPTVIGYNNDTSAAAGGEATLDVQWVQGTGQGVPTTTWSFPPGDYILNWALAVGNATNPPLSTSISYGDTEIGYDQATGYGRDYITRMDVELKKMATRGRTVIAGSGDAGWTNVGESGNDISPTDTSCGIMRAFYPSLSPYVTSLSSTQVTSASGAEEVLSVRGGRAWTAGGGFSNQTGVQPWQTAAVGAYLSKTPASELPPQSMWNAYGRGYSDLATVGDNIVCIWRGQFFPLGGTSASGPIMAGLVSLLNDARLNAGMPPLGHLNPRLYAWAATEPTAFNDIVIGRNNDGDVQPPGSKFATYCPHGFPAATGWDAPTGLGSPVMEKLFALALQASE